MNHQDQELRLIKKRQTLLFGIAVCLFLMMVLPHFPDPGAENTLSISFLTKNVLPAVVIYLILHYLLLPYWPRIKDWFDR